MKKQMTDYIDEDIAYLLGLIVARGSITENARSATVMIEFPFKNLEVEGIEKSYKSRDEFSLSLDRTVNRIRYLDIDTRKETLESSCQLIIETRKRSLFMRELNLFLKEQRNYLAFQIPNQIFDTDESIQKEFMRGFADVAGSARQSNQFIDGRYRIYLDVLNGNWILPVQLCTLLQDYLKVPVQTLDWGHPNIRNGNLEEFNKGRPRAWAREHQLKIFAEDFLRIGFYIRHKNEILKELADYNKRNYRVSARYCTPPKPIDEKKPHHPSESDPALPEENRGKHFDAYWQVCEALGCPRCKSQTRLA